MNSRPKYVSRQPDENGFIRYSQSENATWATLYARQSKAIRDAACDEFIAGLELLDLPQERIPQLDEISRVLQRETGWSVEPVPALIPAHTFFGLLASRRFPAATFIRRWEDLDYIEEPDIFHELFGHTPMLTHPHFAEFTRSYGELGLSASEADRDYLARLYWFTVEFGLIRPPARGLRIYGGGILSSIGETDYALNSDKPLRERFDPLEAMRTPYRIDIMQPLYFVIEDLEELFELARRDVMALVDRAKQLGSHPPLFSWEEDGEDQASGPRRDRSLERQSVDSER